MIKQIVYINIAVWFYVYGISSVHAETSLHSHTTRTENHNHVIHIEHPPHDHSEHAIKQRHRRRKIYK